MRNDKHLAIQLRQKGKSYNYICKELNIPKSTVSGWLSDLKWSQEIKNNLTKKALYIAKKRLLLINKERTEKWRKWRQQFKEEAIAEFPKLKNNNLFVAGIMLYWAEGDNSEKSRVVRLTNTDPRMIKLFINFTQKICRVPKNEIKMTLILYPDLNDNTCKNYWSSFLDIPLEQFYKTQFIKGRHPTKRLVNGICMIKIGGSGLKEKIITWINLLSESYNGIKS